MIAGLSGVIVGAALASGVPARTLWKLVHNGKAERMDEILTKLEELSRERGPDE